MLSKTQQPVKVLCVTKGYACFRWCLTRWKMLAFICIHTWSVHRTSASTRERHWSNPTATALALCAHSNTYLLWPFLAQKCSENQKCVRYRRATHIVTPYRCLPKKGGIEIFLDGQRNGESGSPSADACI